MDFLTTKGIAASIEKVFRTANDFIVIVSPYVKVDKTYIDRLHEADNNGVSIYLIFGKEKLNELEKEKFQDFQNLNIYYLENLHAKCYMNESTIIITSMNLYGYSEENNREFGIEINQDDNYDLFEDILKEIRSIKSAAEDYNIINNGFQKNNTRNSRHYNGYCIRCGKRIDFDMTHPLCDDCYQIWAAFGNTEYIENYCHKCGREIDQCDDHHIDYDHPLCFDCWKDSISI